MCVDRRTPHQYVADEPGQQAVSGLHCTAGASSSQSRQVSCNLQQTGPLLYCDVETIQVTEEGTLGDNDDQAGGCSVLIEPAYTPQCCTLSPDPATN